MMKRFGWVLCLVLACSAQGDVITSRLSRSLADALYCQLAGCTMTGTIALPNGAATAPALTFSADTTEGFFRTSATRIGLAFSGTEKIRFDSTAFSILDDAGIFRLGSAADVVLSRRAANSWNFGSADAAVPVAQTLTFQGARGGTDTNASGANATITFSLGTGTGSGGSGIFQTGRAGSSGTTANTATNALVLDAKQQVQMGRQMCLSGFTPTASSTGTGTGPTNTVDTGSCDSEGTITVTAGSTPAASGTLTVTFSTGAGAFGTNAPVCTAFLGNGTGTWNARATVIGGAYSTTSAVFNWDNNAVSLTATSTYKFHYTCVGK